jgi:hypothetical protein
VTVALSVVERQEFLAQPHVAALSVAAGPDRGPLSVPIWYVYVPGEGPWVLTPPDSRKARLIAAAGRFTLLVHRTSPTVRYVSVEGRVSRSGPATADQVRRVACRYLPPERVEAYVEFARDEHVIVMQPERWLSSDLGPG